MRGKSPNIVVDRQRSLRDKLLRFSGAKIGLPDDRSSWKKLVEWVRRRRKEEVVVKSCLRVGSEGGSRRGSTLSHVLHQVPNPRSREVKAAKSLSIIVLFFMVSWFPLYTINCVQAFCTDCQVEPNLMFFTIILSHLNSAINPFLYAYHMKDFRNALKMFILHRLLRRPMDLDYMYGRSLVSQHHHSIYRANMTLPTHSSSPHMANTQTTPLMSSPSPLPDTPLDELRSQSSTVSSYDPLSSRHNMSPSSSIPPAIMTSSEDVQYPSSRPRAATITTHTSPASSRTRLVSTGNHSQPLCSDNFPQTLNPKDVTAWRASTLSPLSTSCTLGPTVSHHHTNTRPNHDMTICIADINFTSRDASATSTHSFHSASCDGGQSIITDTMTPEVITEASLQTSNTKCCPDSPSTTKVEQKETVFFAQPVSGESDVIATRSSTYSSHTCSSVLTNSDTNSEGLIKQVLLSSSCKEHLNMSTLNKTSSNETLYSNPLLDDISISNQSNLTKCKEERHGDESKILLTEQQDKKIPVREFIEPDSNEETLRLINHTSPVIPNGNVCNFPAMPVDDKCKPLHDEEPSSCNAPTLPCLEPTTEENKLGNCQEKADDRTSEQSCVSKEFGKYLPQILRRREGGLRSKCSKKKRNWWTELMRQKSYHGISFELKSSKHMKRAQSISGALDS
ncbi:uncharacterized protein [Cherax quadricarinatus]|uniref:uncharacterized protein isoform X2 n=1 Tax=Cherax quadricarinatus TaxID=27406 RepID=UPI00387E3679